MLQLYGFNICLGYILCFVVKFSNVSTANASEGSKFWMRQSNKNSVAHAYIHKIYPPLIPNHIELFPTDVLSLSV